MDRAALEDLLAPAKPFLIKRMFGGHGVFDGDAMIALESGGTVYLKADEVSAPAFEERGCETFSYGTRKGERRSIGAYRRLPEDAFDDPDVMREWFGMARAAAARIAMARTAPRKRRPKGQATSG
jgi:DNA transformation protein